MKATCHMCSGTGTVSTSQHCSTCGGTGWGTDETGKSPSDYEGGGPSMDDFGDCVDCGGSGYTTTTCRNCNGTGYVEDPKG